MKSPKLTILLLLLLFWSISSLLQTGINNLSIGLVNVNQQLNIETINQNSNTLCYTQIFARPFQNKPQVSTALTLFDIDNCQDYQLAIKTRKSQLSLTEVKFLVVGRKSLGLWKRVSFTYFAADLSDIVTAVYYAGIIQTNIDTVDLSGCGKILRQQFIVPVVEKWANPQIAIFLTAFDLTTTTYNSQASLFQVSIQKLHYKNQTLTVSVSRKSPVQIYSVSFSYVIINTQQQTTFKFQSFYNTEIANFKTGTSQGSRWREVKQKLEFWKGGQFYGFNQFSFGNSGNDRRRELAITLTDTHVLFGSKIATELEQVTINYLLIRQRSPCTQNQITLYDPISNTQKCEQCPQSKRQTSNPQKNACICLPNHFTYQDRCMPIPQNSQFSHQKNGYICESGYEWIYHKKQDKFYCKVPPMFTTWNAEAQKFVCVAGYYFVDGKCQIPKENQIYDVAIKGFRCSEGSTKVDGRCVKAHQNQVWSESLKQFVCVENTYRIESLCLSTPKNMQYSHSVHKFVCLKSFYPVNENICEPLPQNRVWDSSEKRLKCIEGLYEVQQGCKQLPKNCDYSASDKVFNCIKGYYRLVGGLCQKPGQNQQYELSTQQFVCASGSYKIGGKCKYPIKDSYYCSIANTFLCKQGYFRIGEECLSPGKNQVYNQLTKSFKCSDGFYSANNQQCSKVPQNKVYSIQLKKLVCVNGYFEMSDSSCQKPSVNQEYNAKLKIFACRQNYYLIDKFCRLLPQNCIYNSPNSSFTCRAGFYRREYQCLVCQTNCLQCQSNQKCTKCSEGYEAKNGKCEEKCGDGIRIGHECDDGNVNDGDGCSKECIIEQGWSCKGGSKTTPDTCRKLGLTTVKPSETQIVPIIAGTGSTYQNKNVELRMVGLSHLFGKIILNIKTDYIPEKLLQNASQINSMFKVLTNCKIPLKVSTMYIKNSTYTFVILYDFNLEPIPDYLTRVQMNQEIKQKYYADWKVKPLLIRIDPAIMAKQDKNQDNLLV